jgi:hypothetical protein
MEPVRTASTAVHCACMYSCTWVGNSACASLYLSIRASCMCACLVQNHKDQARPLHHPHHSLYGRGGPAVRRDRRDVAGRSACEALACETCCVLTERAAPPLLTSVPVGATGPTVLHWQFPQPEGGVRCGIPAGRAADAWARARAALYDSRVCAGWRAVGACSTTHPRAITGTGSPVVEPRTTARQA